ncbi:MAG TPA: F0F1 ATP synthase subunit A [Methylomirabilota bacterium]|nr:F0F1 ATP synthase subunit A [Methylomirabilota bacterium]
MFKSILAAFCLLGFVATGLGAAAGAGDGEHAHHELPPGAVPLLEIGPFTVTNSMVVTWVVAILLILLARKATRNIQEIPSGLQNFWEWIVESLYDFLEGIIGHDLVRKTFWFFATLFIMILACNWLGLIPGVGSIGWGPSSGGAPLGLVYADQPILRGANADMNMTLAMAMIFFTCWTWWALKANGAGGLILHLFGPKGDSAGALKFLMIFVFIAVGLLEVVSILFRPISLSFRLYGNIFAGETMLETMAMMGGKYFGWLIPIPFYFMELLVGLVQALVFMLLTAVFTLLICTHEEEGHGQAHH